MNSLYYEDIPRIHLHIMAFVFPLTCFKIEFRKFYAFSLQQSQHIHIEFFNIDCFQAFKIIIAVRIFRCQFSVYKIIIQTDQMWRVTKRCKLDWQPVCKRSLSRGRRSCDHNKSDITTTVNLSCDLSNTSFLQSFLNTNDITDLSLTDLIIEISNGINPKHITPFSTKLQCFKQVLSCFESANLHRIWSRWNHQDKATLICQQVKRMDISCTW